jgi:hypothetical protein
MSTIPETVPFSETISQTAQEGLGVGGELIAKSVMPEIGDSGETSQPIQEGLGAGGEVIAKSEIPEIGDSGETSHPRQEGLRLGQDVRMSTMPGVRQFYGETSRPVCFYSFSRVHFSSFPRRVIKLQVWGLRLVEVLCIYVHTIVLTEVSVGRVALRHVSCSGVFSVVL